jgi:MFS family permease
VPADEGAPSGRRQLSKGRMEGFSDGVFGFAMTLLVVDLALHPPGTARQQVLHAWPSFLAYLISFLTIGAGWLAHTGLTDRLARLLGAALDRYARREHLYSSHGDEEPDGAQHKLLPVLIGYVAAMLLGLALRTWRSPCTSASRCSRSSHSGTSHSS